MSPFEPAKVRLSCPREVALQEVKCLGKVASLPVVVRLAQVGRVGLPPGDSLEPTQVDRSRGRADGNHCQKRVRRRKRGFPPAPAPEFLKRADRPRLDGLAVQEAAQLVGQLLCRRVAAIGFFLQAFETDCFEVAGRGGIQQMRSDRFGVDDLSQRVLGWFTYEGRAAGEE